MIYVNALKVTKQIASPDPAAIADRAYLNDVKIVDPGIYGDTTIYKPNTYAVAFFPSLNALGSQPTPGVAVKIISGDTRIVSFQFKTRWEFSQLLPSGTLDGPLALYVNGVYKRRMPGFEVLPQVETRVINGVVVRGATITLLGHFTPTPAQIDRTVQVSVKEVSGNVVLNGATKAVLEVF